jgi:hypothetical protein
MVLNCPAAEEYMRPGRALVKNDRLHLPTGDPIPNDGSGGGLKYAIDALLATNSMRPGEPLTASPRQTTPVSQHDTLSARRSFSKLCFQPYITAAADSDDDRDNRSGELYDIHEVFAAE